MPLLKLFCTAVTEVVQVQLQQSHAQLAKPYTCRAKRLRRTVPRLQQPPHSPPRPTPECVCAPLTVVVPWVCDVLLEAVNGAQAAHCCLAAEANERQHGQAPVLELLELRLLRPHAHGVKGERAQHAALRAGKRAGKHAQQQQPRQHTAGWRAMAAWAHGGPLTQNKHLVTYLSSGVCATPPPQTDSTKHKP